MRPSEIYRASLLTSGAITNRIDKVEEIGLVTRKRDPDDRRGISVQLTTAGKALADKAIDRHCAELSKCLAQLLPQRDQQELIKLLAKLLFELELEGH
jgi:DNA-binding MarR family transcriptional regulator